MSRTLTSLLLLISCLSFTATAQDYHTVSFSIKLSGELRDQIQPEGRLFIFLSENTRGEPRNDLWPYRSKVNNIFARNERWDGNRTIKISSSEGFDKTCNFTFANVPEGSYSIQVLWEQDYWSPSINNTGNLYSKVLKSKIDSDEHFDILIDQVIKPLTLSEHDLVKYVEIVSDTLSTWWDRPVSLKASVLLPASFKGNPDSLYPVRYNIAGYGGRYNRVNRLVSDRSDFLKWWTSDEAPQVVNVFLDSEGPFGDCYQLDSDNNGPYGYALTHELIPHIEKTFRCKGTAQSRFLDGCSTGGWVSLALQIYYPDLFGGVFSYSPDAVEFENYQTVNIYNDKNAFVNEWGNARPVMRDQSGDPIIVMKKFITYENVLGYNGTYTTSGGQFSAHNALYGPRAENGLPKPLFDPFTGDIDQSVAEQWKKYDLLITLRDNWEDLGPKLQGKIWLWMGDMDNFLLNPASRTLEQFLENTGNPAADATLIFEPMAGHCTAFSHREVLEMIREKIN